MFVASLVRVEHRLCSEAGLRSARELRLGRALRVVTARLVLPAEVLAEIAAQLLDAPADTGAATMGRFCPTVN
ncbi:hypothetical protein C7G41_35260 [Bradyrhizobium sp. MOS002]|nr:hypothetical protein C7G41_35260 [Bradyrhizobium sp. MOS002]